MSGGQIMIVLIVTIVSVISLIKARYRALHGITKDSAGNELRLPQNDAAAAREIAELRQRLEVLERIATENRHAVDVAREIESLRDK